MRKKHIILAFFAILIIYGACVDEEETGSDGQTEYVYDQDNPNTWQKTEWSADDIPMVHLRDSTRYVCDPENIMQEVYRDSADMVLAQLERNYQIESVFIIVSHVKGGDTFRMAQDVGNKYGVGYGDRGLMVVCGYQDHSPTPPEASCPWNVNARTITAGMAKKSASHRNDGAVTSHSAFRERSGLFIAALPPCSRRRDATRRRPRRST